MRNRLELLEKNLGSWGIDALLIENPIDLLYLTGLKLSKGRLVVLPNTVQLLVDGRYFSYALLHAPCPVSLWTRERLALNGTVGFDSAWTTVAGRDALHKEAPQINWVPILKPLKSQRAVKDIDEIKYLKKAAALTWEGIQHIRGYFKRGVSESELALEFEFFVRRHGATELSFEPIIAFGANSALPHHRATSTKLENDQIILVDVGAVVDHYCGDVTRVFFFGRPDPELARMHHFVLQAEKAARATVRDGETFGTLDRAARAVFAKSGVEELFSHSLGHGIGLETHEYPLIRWDGDDQGDAIRHHMVFTIEPGLYRPGLGGIRYENTGVATEMGFESFYPDSID